MDSSICSSVNAARAAQSVFPRRGSSRETTVIFPSFVPARAPRRNEPALLAAERAGDRDFPAMDVSEDLVPDFVMAVGSTDERVAVENPFHILEVDLVDAQIACALLLMPSERANAREQLLHVFIFRHSEAPPRGGCDTIRITEGSL